MTELFGTLGPGCADRSILKEMLKRGMDGMRLNLSHTSLQKAGPMLEAYFLAAQDVGKNAELLLDLQGPELRVRKPDTPLYLQEGKKILVSADNDDGIIVPDRVMEALENGDSILIDDGVIKLEVEVTDGESALAYIRRGGIINSRASIKVVDKDIAGPVLTEEDLDNLRHAEEYGVTAVMQPYVSNAEEMRQVRQALIDNGLENVRLFAKIESVVGYRALDSIIDESDMIVIARGDLGNDMPLWELPVVQKEMADLCNRKGKPFLVVTQMMTSMINSPVPTRAEVSDIFRAVMEGASALMVTNETAVGKYPVEVIRYLKNTADCAERYKREHEGE